MAEYMDFLARGIGHKSYNEYLKSEHWQEFSSGMRAKRCYCCHKQGRLQIHHITYENLGKELPCDVVTVCGNCHEEIHARVKNQKLHLKSAHIHLRKQILKDGRKPSSCNKKECQKYVKDPCLMVSDNKGCALHPQTAEEVLYILEQYGFVKGDKSPTLAAKFTQLFDSKKKKWNIGRFYDFLKTKRKNKSEWYDKQINKAKAVEEKFAKEKDLKNG